MALRMICNTSTITPYPRFLLHRPSLVPSSRTASYNLHIVSAAKKLSSRTGKFDSKNKKGNREDADADASVGAVEPVENFEAMCCLTFLVLKKIFGKVLNGMGLGSLLSICGLSASFSR